MEKTKFDLLFEDIQNKFINKENQPNCTSQSPYPNEEYIHEFIINGEYKVIIAKDYDDATNEIFYEFLVGKLDRDTNEVYDWPLYESSNEFETMDEAIEAAEDWVIDWIDDLADKDEFED